MKIFLEDSDLEIWNIWKMIYIHRFEEIVDDLKLPAKANEESNNTIATIRTEENSINEINL